MSIEATDIFNALNRNAQRWREALDLRDEVADYIRNGPTPPKTYIPPPATRATGRTINLMA